MIKVWGFMLPARPSGNMTTLLVSPEGNLSYRDKKKLGPKSDRNDRKSNLAD